MQVSILPTDLPAAHAPLSPALGRALAASGFDLGLCPAERDAGERWLETALMTTFRDTGREDVFDALYRRARVSMVRWITQLLSARRLELDPVDVLQDTFVNIFRYARGFRSEEGAGFRGWARTIAANVVRRARMRREFVSLSALPSGVAEPEDLRLGPQRVCQSEEQRQRLARAWTLLLLHYAQAHSELSPRDQSALEMIEVEGLTYQEAGQRLGVGRSNMKMIMFRARKRLRAAIARRMPQVEPIRSTHVGDRGIRAIRAVG